MEGRRHIGRHRVARGAPDRPTLRPPGNRAASAGTATGGRVSDEGRFNASRNGFFRRRAPIVTLLSSPVLRWLPAGVLLAAGCTAVGPQYTPPQLTPPERWTRVDDARFDSTRRAELAEWWRQLHDPALSALVEAALTANYDLKRALASVREARARRLLASAEYFPTLSLSVDASRAKAGR